MFVYLFRMGFYICMLFKIKFGKCVHVGCERMIKDKKEEQNTINQVSQKGKDI